MYYNSSTDKYENHFMEQILNTGIITDVPYKIDKGKYNTFLAENKQISRFNDTDVVTFSFSESHDEDSANDLKSKVLFVWPQNLPKGSRDEYDCFQYWYDDNDDFITSYNNFVRGLFKSVICIDVTSANNVIKELTVKKDKLNTQIYNLDNYIKNNRLSKIICLNKIIDAFDGKLWNNEEETDMHFSLFQNHWIKDSDFVMLPNELNKGIIKLVKEYRDKLL